MIFTKFVSMLFHTNRKTSILEFKKGNSCLTYKEYGEKLAKIEEQNRKTLGLYTNDIRNMRISFYHDLANTYIKFLGEKEYKDQVDELKEYIDGISDPEMERILNQYLAEVLK